MKIDAVQNAAMPIARSKPGDYRAAGTVTRESLQAGDLPPSSDRILYNRLEDANSETLDMARSIRSIDNTFDQIDRNVHQMHELLDGIVKNYPPFPNDSSERVQALRQFSALRKMIDQLTFPPPEESPVMILGDTSAFPQAGDWEPNIPESDTVSLRHQPLHTDSGGLDIPDLAPDATDEQIRDVLDKTAAAIDTIDRRRQAFVTDVNRLIGTLS